MNISFYEIFIFLPQKASWCASLVVDTKILLFYRSQIGQCSRGGGTVRLTVPVLYTVHVLKYVTQNWPLGQGRSHSGIAQSI